MGWGYCYLKTFLYTSDLAAIFVATNMSSGDSSYSGLHKAEFVALMCIVSLVALLFFIVCGICIRRKHNNVMVSSHRDQYKFFSDNSSEVLSL